MLKRLKYQVTFLNPQPERTFSQELTFEKGLTAITGENGSGKSLILEMVEYAFDGTSALRGIADDYKNLEVTLDFEINGVAHTIFRSNKAVTLSVLGTPVATGTRPVNAAIRKLFGYSSEVFQVANIAKQGKVEELGNLRPAERQKLVDETIGLNVLDDLTKYINDEAKNVQSVIRATESILVAPNPPLVPEGLQAPEVYRGEVARLQQQLIDLGIIKALADKQLPVLPMRVELHAEDDCLLQYQGEDKLHASFKVKVSLLQEQLSKLPEVQGITCAQLHPDDAELEGYQRCETVRLSKEAELAATIKKLAELPVCAHTEESIAAIVANNTLIERWEQKKALLETGLKHDCPKCQHHWVDVDPRVAAEFADVPEGLLEIAWVKPSEIGESRKALELSKKRSFFVEHQVGLEKFLVDYPNLSERVIAVKAARVLFEADQEKRKQQATRDQVWVEAAEAAFKLSTIVDRGEIIRAILQARQQSEIYAASIGRIEQEINEINAAKVQVLTFGPTLVTDFNLARENLELANRAKLETEAYLKATETYDKAIESLTDLRKELSDWEAGKKAVAELRLKVKGFLLPSLNKVASDLINDMTGGALSWIVVNEKFEISVQGQRIETLSGAGKSVANLALRLALGQVLTSRVFNMVMLDEIDAACDDSRANYIAECLQRLTSNIHQIIQVSHKADLVADQHIRL